MSKAVTNDEVEDVLSSIRRLVSEDKRPLAGLRAAPPAAVSKPDSSSGEGSLADIDEAPVSVGTDRLVLTPALRVADTLVPEPEQTSHPSNEGPLDLGSVARDTWTPNDAPDEATLEEAKAYKGPMVLFPAAQDSVSDDERDAAMDALDALVHDAVEAEKSAVVDQSDEIGDDDPAEDLTTADALHSDDALVDGDYGDEGYWSDDERNAEPDYTQTHDADVAFTDDTTWDEEDDLAELIDAPRTGDDTVEDLAEVAPDKVEDEAAIEEPELRSASVTQIPLTAKIAALEAAVGKIKSGWEPDGDETEDLTVADTPAMAWEDDVELDATGAPFSAEIPRETVTASAEPEAAEPEPTSAAFGTDDQVMDEEALRDLVSEIVRSELQGALGERITRNVRKLVRREIHRALTAQELE